MSTCPRCGVTLPADSPEQLCPGCLLQAGLESGTQTPARPLSPPTAIYGRGFVAPAVAELQQLFPSLEILEMLGQGGMGAVYKAKQITLDRLVAIKILPASDDPAFAERFTREARALAKLSHPNIVGVHDFGQTASPAGGQFYFVMEYVDGVNIRQAMRSGELGPDQALKIVPQICDALQFAHDEGIVHRDIKPENILIDKKGRVKIADFGLAKIVGSDVSQLSLTGTQQAMGTIHYMAPEQVEGAKNVDHRADIYSLGVTFYEMLTGELPLGRFSPPSQKVQIDVRLDEVVLRSLEKEPQKRFQHASDVKTEVETISRTPGAAPGAALPAAEETLEAEVARVFEEEGKIPAIKVYRKRTGAGLAAAKKAVEELAESEGLEDPDDGGYSWLFWLAVIGVSVWGANRGFKLPVSPVIWLPIGLAAFLIPAGIHAWRNRAEPRGQVAGVAIGCFLLAILSMAFSKAEIILDAIHQATGVEPGEHDLHALNAIFLGTILLALGLLFWFLYKLWWGPLPGMTESRGWMGVPVWARWLVKALLTVICVLQAFTFLAFQGSSSAVPGPDGNVVRVSKFELGLHDAGPWFVSETRVDGFTHSIHVTSLSFLAGIVAGFLFWLLLVVERIERRAKHPDRQEGIVAEAREIAGYMMATGIGYFILKIMVIVTMGLAAMQLNENADRKTREILEITTMIGGMMTIASIFTGILAILASAQLRRLQSPGFVRFAGIMLVLPFSPGWLLGLPMGIWILRFLGRPEVMELMEAAQPESEQASTAKSREELAQAPGCAFVLGYIIAAPFRDPRAALLVVSVLASLLCMGDWFSGFYRGLNHEKSWGASGLTFWQGWAVMWSWVALAFFLVVTWPRKEAWVPRGAAAAALSAAAGVLVISLINERPVPNIPDNAVFAAKAFGKVEFGQISNMSDLDVVRQGVTNHIITMQMYPTAATTVEIMFALAGLLLAAVELQRALREKT